MTKLIQNNTRVYHFSDLASIRALRGQDMKQGAVVVYTGAEGTDGTERIYVWNTTSTETDNSDNVIKLTDTTTGRLRAMPYSTELTPRDYAAVGDGTNNDDTELQAWIDGTPSNGVVKLTEGKTYKCNSTLTITNPIHITGYGAEIDFSGIAAGIGLDFQTSNWSLKGLKLTGPGNSSYVDNSTGINCLGTNNHPSAPTFRTDFRIEDCEIDGWGDNGILLRYCKRLKVLNCKITNIGYSALESTAVQVFEYDGNQIDGISPGTDGNSYNIIAARNMTSAFTETSEPRCSDGRITNNTLTGNPLWEAIDCKAAERIYIAGNYIQGCKIGMTLGSSEDGTGSGNRDLAFRDSIVTGNTMIGGLDDAAIYLAGAFTANTASVNDYARNVTISNNYIEDYGLSTDADSTLQNGAVKIEGCQNINVVNNIIAKPRVAGIAVGIWSDNFRIEGNMIEDPYDGGGTPTTETRCIAIRQHTAREGWIAGNTFSYRDATLTNPAKYSIWAQSPTSGTHSGNATGTDDSGGSSATVLTDSGESWTTNEWVGRVIHNTTDGCFGTCISNTGTTITVDDLLFGTNNTFADGDGYEILDPTLSDVGANFSISPYKLYDNGHVVNLTDNSWGPVTDHNADTVTAVLVNGLKNQWANGDSYSVNSVSFSVGRNFYNNNDATHLLPGNLLQPGISIDGDHVENGVVYMQTQNGSSSVSRTITFKRPFPTAPRIFLNLLDDPHPGQSTVGSILSAQSITTTSFLLVMLVADGSNFTSTETDKVAWEAKVISEN